MRVAVFTNIPEIAAMVTGSLRRLGHVPVGVVALLSRGGVRQGDLDWAGVGGTPDARVAVCANRAQVTAAVEVMQPDVILSWAYPKRVPGEVLSSVDHGGINFHPSLLPRHRGPNPLGWTLRSADPAYGATWHRMVSAFDAGAILAQSSFPVSAADTVARINLRLSSSALRMLPAVLDMVRVGEPGRPQDESAATFAPPFGEDYAHLDFSRPAALVHAQVRAWTLAVGTGSVDGPFATLDGIVYRVTDSALSPIAVGRRVMCSDGPIWLSGIGQA